MTRRLSVILLFVILLAGLLAPSVRLTQAAIPGQWTYPGWQYRIPITIYNPNNYTLTNYQLKLEINSSWPIWAYVSENGSDIRFATTNGSIINYYIENWNYSSKTATVWIKIPTLLTLSYTTIYMYYDNPSAKTESNPNNVFIWFDNASTDKSSDYEFVDLYNNGVSATLTWESSEHRYLLNWTTDDTNGLVIKNLTLSNAEIDITFTLPQNIPTSGTGSNVQFGAVVRYSSAGVYYLRYETAPSPDDLTIMKEANPPTTAETNLATYTYGGDNDIAGKTVEIRAWVRGYKLGMWCSVGNATLDTIDSQFSTGQWGVWFGFSSNQYLYIDKIIVRAYADKTPTYKVGSEEKYIPPASVTIVFHDDAGNVINNVYLTVNGTSLGIVNSSTVLTLTPGWYSFTASKQHYITTTAKVSINSSNTIVLNLTRESYTVKFYAYSNRTELNNFTVYANGTLLGTFDSGESTLVKYGNYIFKFEKNGYRSAIQIVTVAQNGTVVTFTNIMPANVYLLTLTFYDAINNTELNNVTVRIDSQEKTLNSGVILPLQEGTHELVFEKQGYLTRDITLNITGDTNLAVYLEPANKTSEYQNVLNVLNQTNLVKNLTANLTITPINPYAKAILDSGGSFGKTVELAIRGDDLVKLIMPQLFTFAFVILVLFKTDSPLAALGSALIMWAMWTAVIGEAPNLRNSGVTFTLVVFLVAWTLWDLFYNYSRET